jgi:hypothetical protein
VLKKFFLTREDYRDGVWELRGNACALRCARLYRKSEDLLHFDGKNFAEVVVGFDQKKVIGRLTLGPVTKAGTHGGEGNTLLAGEAENIADELIEGERGRKGAFWFGITNEDAAAMAKVNSAITSKLAITGADGVGMEMETAGEFASAGQSLAGT